MRRGRSILRRGVAALWIAACLCVLPALAWAFYPPHNQVNGIDCDDYHSEAIIEAYGSLVPRGAAQEALCKTYHKPTGRASSMTRVANHVVDGASTTIDCGSCHAPRGAWETTDAHPGGVTGNSLVRANTAKYVDGRIGTISGASQRPIVRRGKVPILSGWNSHPTTGRSSR